MERAGTHAELLAGVGGCARAAVPPICAASVTSFRVLPVAVTEAAVPMDAVLVTLRAAADVALGLLDRRLGRLHQLGDGVQALRGGLDGLDAVADAVQQIAEQAGAGLQRIRR